MITYQLLDEMDIVVDGTESQRSIWIHQQRDQDLYSLGCWLMMHLTEQKTQRDHHRSNIRDLLTSWNGRCWSVKQRHYLGHSLIDFWPVRQLDQDPRYLF